MDIRIRDEALFVVPRSGALWAYDFGNKPRVIRQTTDHPLDPPFQIAQVRADERELLLVSSTVAPPSIAEQYAMRRLLAEQARGRGVAFVLEQADGFAVVIGSDADVVEHFAAAAAVVRTVWSWDESRLFTVRVDEFEFAVELEHDGDVWTAWPDPVSRGRALP